MIVGVDIGYGYTKATSGTNQVVFPSVVGKSERVRYESDLDRASENHHDGQIAVITELGDRFVGELGFFLVGCI